MMISKFLIKTQSLPDLNNKLSHFRIFEKKRKKKNLYSNFLVVDFKFPSSNVAPVRYHGTRPISHGQLFSIVLTFEAGGWSNYKKGLFHN